MVCYVLVRLFVLNKPVEVYGLFSEVMLSVAVRHKGFYWRAPGMDALLTRGEAVSGWLGAPQMSANKMNYTGSVMYLVYFICDGKK